MKDLLSKSIFGVIVISVLFISSVQAQCAMCSLTAQAATENGNTQGFGLNDGILFLLFMPYLAVIVVGILWYKKYRKKPAALKS
jgi:hypothetical protein